MGAFRFDAFISYVTETDYDLARHLEGFLGRFHELPTPESMPLKQLRVWRDETGRSAADVAGRAELASMLESYLAQCRYLLVLWSKQSRDSEWVRFELDWFRRHRDPAAILIGVTDAADPAAKVEALFSPEVLQAGLHRRAWYDFRGFRKDRPGAFVKLRDFDEACVQLAADLNGRSPAEIQPIWWRNRVREQQERAEREEQARRRLEVSECNARLEAARGWYERAFVFFEQRRYRHGSRCLLSAVAVAPPNQVPDHYPTTLENPGWAANAWALLQYARRLTPRLERRIHLPAASAESQPLRRRSFDSEVRCAAWLDGGRAVGILEDDRSVRVLHYPSAELIDAIVTPPDAGPVTAWAASPSSNHVAVGTSTGHLSIWNGKKRDLVWRRAHRAGVTAVAFSAVGDSLATGAADGEVRLWHSLDAEEGDATVVANPTSVSHAWGDDAPDGADQATEKNEVRYVGFTRAGRTLVFMRGNLVSLWAPDGTGARAIASSSGSTAIACDIAGERLAVGDHDIVRVVGLPRAESAKDADEWSATRNTETGLLYVGHHRSFIEQVAFSAQDRRLLTRDLEGKVCVWLGHERELERGQSFHGASIRQGFGRANRGTLLKHLEGLGRVEFLEPHPRLPDRLLVQREGHLEEWDIGFSLEPCDGWRNATKGSRYAAWMPDGRAVIAGSDDGLVQLLSLGEREPVRVLMNGGAAVGYLSVARDGASVAVASEDGRVRVLRIDDGEALSELCPPTVPFSVIHVGDEGLAIGCADGSVYHCTVSGRREMRRLGTVREAVLGIAATPDGVTVVASSATEVSAWDVRSGLERWSTSDSLEHEMAAAIGRVAISPDGQLVAYGTVHGALVCLRAGTGELVSVTHLPPSVPLKPEHVTAVAIGNDSRIAFAGLWDGTLCVLDVVLGRELYRFSAHSKVITSVAQSPNSSYLLTSSLDTMGDNEYVRIFHVLDPHASEQPRSRDAAWVADMTTQFLESHGDPLESRGSRPEDGILGLSFNAPNAEPSIAPARSRSGPDFAALRAALLAAPESPQRHLDLAMAFLAADQRERAKVCLERVTRLGGDSLIQDGSAGLLVAESLIAAGRPRDAIPWLLRAAEQGEAEAWLHLGVLYLNGRDVERNERLGATYMRQGAELGNPVAAYNMGVYCEHMERGELGKTDWRRLAFGEPASRDSESLIRAFAWYRRAAEAHFPPAQVRLGDFFAVGQVVPRDTSEARRWYQRAADHGNAEAEEKLAALN